MAEEEKIPDSYEETELPLHGKESAEKYLPHDYPPPPGDWVSHPITRGVLIVIFLGIIGVLIWKWDSWLEYVKDHPYGMGLVGFVLVAIILIIAYSYWRYRAIGTTGTIWWEPDKKKRQR
jgi:uncharacterized membrane protein YeaQ/YmgE (transglycosylase-associated protein family)